VQGIRKTRKLGNKISSVNEAKLNSKEKRSYN